MVAAFPDATLLELDADGWHPSTWTDLDLVDHHRRFLTAPDRYPRHITD